MSKTKAQLEAQVKHDAHLIEGLQAEIRKRDEKLKGYESYQQLANTNEQITTLFVEKIPEIYSQIREINEQLEMVDVVRAIAKRL